MFHVLNETSFGSRVRIEVRPDFSGRRGEGVRMDFG